jgi:hypothetical protein
MKTVRILEKTHRKLTGTVGTLTVIAWTYLPIKKVRDQDLQEVRDIIKRRLPEIHTQILKELNI